MGDPISWYLLPRTASDLQSVMEAIDAKLLTHNQDPSAHGQAGEVVEVHRVSAELDHVDASVTPAKVSDDLTFIKSDDATADVTTAGDYVFSDVPGISFTLRLSKLATVLMIASVFATSSGKDAGPVARISVAKAGGSTSYYPTSYGWYVEGGNTTDNSYYAHSTFIYVVALTAGDYTFKLQGARSTPDETVVILGSYDPERSSLVVVSVGSEVVEI